MANDVKKPIDVYILSGQSNAVGYSFKKGLKKSFPGALIYNSCNREDVTETNWQTLTNNQGCEKKRFGPEVGIAEVLLPLYKEKRPFALIKSGKGGKAIYDYFLSPTSVKNGIGDLQAVKTYLIDGKEYVCGEGYFRLIKTISGGLKKLEEKGYAPNLVGLFWMQGETDAESLSACSVYDKTLPWFLSDIRSFTGKNIPVVIGKIKSPAEFEKEIIAVQEKIVALTENCAIVETKDLKMQPTDTWHYDTLSMEELGKRFAKAMQTLTDI